MSTNNWSLYLLYNTKTNNTYIGCTTNVERRLKQHKRELVGGAKATNKECANWKILAVLSGFHNRSVVMRWEKLIKNRNKTKLKRLWAFQDILNGRVLYNIKNKKEYIPPLGLTLTIY